jgi:putative membrane protein
MRRRNSLLALSLSAAFPLFSHPVFAQGTPVPSPSQKTPMDEDARGQSSHEMIEPSKERLSSGMKKSELDPSDVSFLKKAGQANLAEIKTAELANDRASSPTVKRYAQKIIDDHTSVQSQLKTIAQEKGVMLPTEVNAEQKSAYDKLSKLSGKEFDKAYMKQMSKDHHIAIDLYQKEGSAGHDPDLKRFAEKTLPALKQHSNMADRDVKRM